MSVPSESSRTKARALDDSPIWPIAVLTIVAVGAFTALLLLGESPLWAVPIVSGLGAAILLSVEFRQDRDPDRGRREQVKRAARSDFERELAKYERERVEFQRELTERLGAERETEALLHEAFRTRAAILADLAAVRRNLARVEEAFDIFKERSGEGELPTEDAVRTKPEDER